MAKVVRYNMPGPIDEPQETNSGLDLLPTNNTLIVLPFKGENGPRRPEEVPADNAKSTAEIMDWAEPEVKVNVKTGNPDNPEVPETIKLRGGVEAFSPKAIKQNSPWLRRLEAEFQASKALIDRINKSAQFRKALDDPDTRAAIITKLLSTIKELDGSLPAQEDK